MNLLFFLNSLSPHQMPYIKELKNISVVEDVIVVSPYVDNPERIKLGWNSSFVLDTKGINFMIAPSKEQIEHLLEMYSMKDTFCMFSGINAFKDVSKWFRKSLNYEVKRCIISEPPFIYNHPLWMHKFRFIIQDLKYTKYIQHFFVMGDEYVDYYKSFSKKWNVHSFLYCTAWIKRTLPVPKDKSLKVLYVGNLCERKNIVWMLKSLIKFPFLKIGIVGNGDLMSKLTEIVDTNFDECKRKSTEVHFYGSKSINDIPLIMQQYDVLILPSKYDGWGAVVNEALSLGLYVAVSNNCGSKCLIKNRILGMVFDIKKQNEFDNAILYCIDNLNLIRSSVQERIDWAQANISSIAVSKYFINCLKSDI